MSNGKELTLGESPFTEKQLLSILQRTPTKHIYKRPGKGGGNFDFVTGVYIKKVLNYVFGWRWDFEIKEHGVAQNSVWVLGRLTIRNDNFQPIIVKEQFGRADIKLKRGTNDYLDFGNDLKAAATDALKKCASELGIASDIYGKNEFREIAADDKGFRPGKPTASQKANLRPKLEELTSMLQGASEAEKIADLYDRTGGVTLKNLNITEKHASDIITIILKNEAKL